MAKDGHQLITFGPRANCTLDLCALELSVFRYRPNVPANATFLAYFGLMLILQVIQGVRYKTWGFMGCMVAGCALEMAGYVGRIMLYDNPFSFNAFLTNLVPITVAPVFFCAAIYVQLTRVINHVDRSLSRLNPRFIAFTFVPCDIISLVLQAVGGALSAGATTKGGTQVGVDITKAGLIFQVVTIVVFVTLSTDYLVRLRKSHKKSGLRLEKQMVVMIICLGAATILILGRCIYRIYELKNGYFAPAFRDEGTFIAFESVFMCVAGACLNLGHPGRAFKQPSTIRPKEGTLTEAREPK